MADGAPITPGVGLGVETDELLTALTGTVAKAGTTTLTGTGTAFLTQISAGQIIRVPGVATEDRIVAAVASDTSLTVSVAFAQTSSGQTASRLSHVQRVKPVIGADGVATDVSTTNPMPIVDTDA